MSRNNTPTPQDASSAEPSLLPEFSLKTGTTILDRYVVEGLLGKGGMGSVYRVIHVKSQNHYALKVLHQVGNQAMWKRFENEVRAANKLDHPNLLKVYDSGMLPGGNPFFVMEIVDGESLSDVLKRQGRLPVNTVLKIFIQVGFALAYAHEAGIIHRDLKPSNIMLSKSSNSTIGVIKLVDLGIAKLTGRDEFSTQTLTKTGEILGSPLYMSPEQCLGGAVDKRADLYSMGCAMFEALTGAPPLMGENALSTMMKHQSEVPLSLREASLGLTFPNKIESLISRLLEKDPGSRYSSAQLLTADLVSLEQELQEAQATENSQPAAISTAANVVQTKTKASTPLLKKAAVPIATFCLGILVHAVYQQFDQTLNPKSSQTPAVNRSIADQSIFGLQTERKKPAAQKTSYFSSLIDHGKKRKFVFDKDYGVVGMYQKDGCEAKGTVIFPAELGIFFSPKCPYVDDVSTLSRFRPDELVALSLNDEVSTDFEVMKLLPRYKNLVDLRLEMNVDDSYLRYIDQLPKLDKLNVSNSKVTGANLVKLKRFNQLHLLGFSCIEGKESILKALPSSSIGTLCMEGLDINIADLKQIAKDKNLTELFLGGNPKINDGNIGLLADLPNLSRLHIDGSSVTPACGKTLQKFKNLKTLMLSDVTFPPEKMRFLKSQLPDVDVGARVARFNEMRENLPR